MTWVPDHLWVHTFPEMIHGGFLDITLVNLASPRFTPHESPLIDLSPTP